MGRRSGIVTAGVLVVLAAGLWGYRDSRMNAALAGAPADRAPRLDPLPDEDLLRVFAVGDVGTGDWRQRRVSDAMVEVAGAGRTPVEAILILGDLFYPDGIESADDPRFVSMFQEQYGGALASAPFRPVLGNHDHNGNPDAILELAEREPRWAMEELDYAFTLRIPGADGGMVDFFGIDTTRFLVEPGVDELVLEWLEAELSASEADWQVVFAHHSIDSGGAEHPPPPQLVEALRPVLAEGGVDVFLGGHDHYLALMEPMDGTWPVVSGSGGKVRDQVWNERTLFAASVLGFCELSFSRDVIWLRFFDSAATLLDSRRLAARE